ncbi:MAG: sialate O-acetylesterase [Verrucomicrobiota bacterium]
MREIVHRCRALTTTWMKHPLHFLLRLLPIMLSTHLAVLSAPATDFTHLKEVMFSGGASGEVWLCGGQSNMVMPVSYASDVGEDLFSTPFDVRFFANGQWRKVDSSNVRDLPAVPFFFALARYRVTGKPVGVIVAAEGGTGIEAWVPTAAMPETSIGRKMRTLSDAPEVIEAARLDRAETTRPYGQHRLAHWGLGRAYPSELYQKKVLPLEGTPITGIIWYQGESNADSSSMAAEYDVWLKGLIASWRRLFGEVPFLIVELPHYKSPSAETPTSSNELRAAQKRCADSGNATFLVPAFDLGDEHDIHPKRKRAMGERIAEFIQKNLKN